jgi:Spy/CpxP family protein refolding chaperone
MSKLIRLIFIFLFMIAAGRESYAQVSNSLVQRQRITPAPPRDKKGMGKRLEAARDRLIGKQLDLTDEESAKFWPIYRQYQQELTAVNILKRLNNSSAATNGTEQIDKEIYYESQQVGIRKRYRDAFSKILPPEKVSKLYKSEQEFRDELIKQLSERSERAGN